MKISELANKTGWKLYCHDTAFNDQIKGAYVGDLLSWVMGHGQPGHAWITVQAHANVIAVASLREFACVIICEDSVVNDELINQAQEEGVVLFTTALPAYEVCRTLIALGV